MCSSGDCWQESFHELIFWRDELTWISSQEFTSRYQRSISWVFREPGGLTWVHCRHWKEPAWWRVGSNTWEGDQPGLCRPFLRVAVVGILEITGISIDLKNHVPAGVSRAGSWVGGSGRGGWRAGICSQPQCQILAPPHNSYVTLGLCLLPAGPFFPPWWNEIMMRSFPGCCEASINNTDLELPVRSPVPGSLGSHPSSCGSFSSPS